MQASNDTQEVVIYVGIDGPRLVFANLAAAEAEWDRWLTLLETKAGPAPDGKATIANHLTESMNE